MKNQKLHISRGQVLLLAALLSFGCLLAAVGIGIARYHAGTQDGLIFSPDRSAQVFLGRETDGNFAAEQSEWHGTADGTLQIEFAVANGTAENAHSETDQRVRLRLFASLGAWSEPNGEAFTLSVSGNTYHATIERIAEGSTLYASFGDGWLIRFEDDDGNEPSWSQSGERLSWTTMTLTVPATDEVGLLRLQATAQT